MKNTTRKTKQSACVRVRVIVFVRVRAVVRVLFELCVRACVIESLSVCQLQFAIRSSSTIRAGREHTCEHTHPFATERDTHQTCVVVVCVRLLVCLFVRERRERQGVVREM